MVFSKVRLDNSSLKAGEGTRYCKDLEENTS